MKPEEVPIHFEPETIQFAITTWTMGATLFSEKQGQTLGQLFAILVGDRLQMEKEGKRIDPADLLIGFYQHLEGRIPEELRSEFSSLDPDRFDSTYKALREKAKQSDAPSFSEWSILVKICGENYRCEESRDAVCEQSFGARGSGATKRICNPGIVPLNWRDLHFIVLQV